MAEENLGLDLASQTGQNNIVEAINGLKNLLSRLSDLLTLGSKTITQNGTYDPNDDSLDGYSSLVVNVPNTYTASDEGKVLSNGELVAQSSQTVTQNGTYDTTLKDEVIVDIPTGGSLISKTITQNGTYVASDDNANGYSDVIVNVQDSIGSAFALIDLTKNVFSFGNVTYGASGATFDTVTSYIPLCMPRKNDFTIEIDVDMMQLTSGQHRKFIMPTTDGGFIYRSSGVWAFYYGRWEESNITDGSFFDNSVIDVYIDSNNKWHIYKNGSLVYEPQNPFGLSGYYNNLMVGSYDGNSINNATISAIKVYVGLKEGLNHD